MESQKLLLVDDETTITNNLAPFLRRSGFDVEVAADGKQVLDQITNFQPDPAYEISTCRTNKLRMYFIKTWGMKFSCGCQIISLSKVNNRSHLRLPLQPHPMSD